MAQKIITLGAVAEDGNGEGLRDGGDKINDNFTELYSLITTTHYKVSNLTANSNNVIAGSGFTPAITKEPTSIAAYNAGEEIQGVIKSFTQNGSYYDITLYVTDAFTNAKVKVIC